MRRATRPCEAARAESSSGPIAPIRRIRAAPPVLSDEALVAACAVGDSAALGALFDRHYDDVRRFIHRLAGSDDRDIDDLVQLTFEAVARAAKRFQGRSSVTTWLFGIATNVIRRHVRSEVRRKRLAEQAITSSASDATDPSADVLDRERLEQLHVAIRSLPPRMRRAFVLVYLEGVPVREVAALLGTREGAIRKSLCQGRARLRQALARTRR